MNQKNQVQKVRFSTAIRSTAYQDKIRQAIPDPKGQQRFQAAVLSAVANSPSLQDCDPASILVAALLGESLGLSPSPQLGQYYMVKYGDKAQFQIGYRGLVTLALRSGYYRRLNVITVKEGELIRWDPLTEEIELNINPDPNVRETLPPAGYCAMFEYTNGFRKTIYWTQAQMEAHAKRYSRDYQARGKDSSFWGANFEAMAHKTMLRQLISKWGVMSTDLQTALEADSEIPEQAEQAEQKEEPSVVDVQEVSINDL